MDSIRAHGLDLSRYNGRANWPAVKASGIDFVIIKAGGIYSNTGICYTDDLVDEHVAGAKSVNIPFGLYWFFLPFGTISKQVAYYEKLISQFSPTIESSFIDCESSNGKAAVETTSALKKFIPCFDDMANIATIYTRQSWWDINVLKDPSWNGYWLWPSRWASFLTGPWSDGKYKFRDWNNWMIWQYSGDNNAQAKACGFPGNPPPGYTGDKYNYGDPDLDLNYFNGNEAAFYAWANLDIDPVPEEEVSVEETLKNHEFRITELEKVVKS
jgi:GH25 family lysozyme M1 (1,4-beta-N-acetylmuramidase)